MDQEEEFMTADVRHVFEGRQPIIPEPEDRPPAIPQCYEDLVRTAESERVALGGHMGPLYLDVLSPWELLCARASGRLTNTASEVLSANVLVALASALPHAELSKELVDKRLDAAADKDADAELRSAACRVVGLAVRGAMPERELAVAFAGLLTNLWKETLNELDNHGYTPGDIEAVFGEAFAVPVDEFVGLAKATDYHAGYGAPEVATDLTILLKDGSWLTRDEYDGSEWWQMHRRPSPPADVRHVARLTAKRVGRESLEECNRQEDGDEGA